MVREALNAVLPLVRKPQRYLGGEIHAIRKDHAAVKARLALCFPDMYEIGASNTGMGMLYHIVNSDPRFLAERAYMVDFDMREAMRTRGVPLYGLESFLPLGNFDVIGFTLQYELSYPNIPAMLMLADIKPLSADRADHDPIIIAGGPLTVNPAPLAEIIDAFVIGDGERAVIACLEAVAGKKNRSEKLKALAKIPGVFVPAYPPADFVLARIPALKSSHYPTQPLVPLIEPVQNRLAVEVMRGCLHGCRFCSAGYYYRPLRERETGDVLEQITQGVEKEGWREVSLLSLSTADYSGLRTVLTESAELTEKHGAHLSLPSTRLDRVTADIFQGLRVNRRMGITFAPEAGSERLRRVINKGMTDQEILDNIRLALDKGLSVIKLYFMIGLPTEEEADIDAIISLLRQIQALFKGPGRRSLHVSVAPFCPKPGTPFEREPLLSTEEVRQRSQRIKAAVQGRFTEFHWGTGETARIETILARGGNELSQLMVRAAEEGLLLQSWAEHFNPTGWAALMEKAGLNAADYTGRMEETKPLPWDFVTPKSRKRFLKQELERARAGEMTADCRLECGLNCGACDSEVKNLLTAEAALPAMTAPGAEGRRNIRKPGEARFGYQFFYEKNEEGRFIPYHDMVRLWERALLIAGAPLSYSEGFSPQAQMSFTYPLTLGFTGLKEPFRITLTDKAQPDLLERVNQQLPAGLRLLEMYPLAEKKALENIIRAAEYSVRLGNRASGLLPVLDRFLAAAEWPADIENKSGVRHMDIRPLVLGQELRNGTLLLRLSLNARGMLRVFDFLKSVAGLSREDMVILPVCRTGFLADGGMPL